MMVSCRQCKHFVPDDIGDGSGIGDCSHPEGRQDARPNSLIEPMMHKDRLYWSRMPTVALPLYPDIKRNCGGFES